MKRRMILMIMIIMLLTVTIPAYGHSYDPEISGYVCLVAYNGHVYHCENVDIYPSGRIVISFCNYDGSCKASQRIAIAQ